MTQISKASSVGKIKHWFEDAHPHPSHQNTQLQVADYLTATTAFLLACQEIGSTSPAREELGFSVNVIDFIQRRIRAASQGVDLVTDDVDREMMLRTLCVQIHACIGLAHMLDMNIEGALQELADSGHHRLDRNGQPVFTNTLKPGEGSSVRRPNYIQYT